MKKLQCAEARQIDLVDYLASLGHEPKKTRNNDYWYLSPLREEKTPSFKVNRRFNVWYDHGTGKGGDLIDFGTLYFNCSTSDLLNKLSQQPPILAFSFHRPEEGCCELPYGRFRPKVAKRVAFRSFSYKYRSFRIILLKMDNFASE